MLVLSRGSMYVFLCCLGAIANFCSQMDIDCPIDHDEA